MGNITNEDWEWLEEKYGKLLHHIGYRIGGDSITNDHDDSYQNLCIAVMDTINTFDKTQNVPFSEYKETAHFDKYLKTVLWNRKNNLGTKIQRREPLRRQVTINEQLVKDKVNNPVESFEPFGVEELDADVREIINEISLDGKIIKQGKGLNVSRLCRNTGKSKSQIKYAIDKLKKNLNDYNETE
mgnify:CR=1 FL=1|tara:strand:- start:1265 stop:1819 length:555 start_codon:yes stop_codon:yes gene_type:complete